MFPDFDTDLQEISRQLTKELYALKGARLFLTGGTGFIGSWLMETIRYANDQNNLNIHVTVLTRNPAAFQTKCPHLSRHSYFDFVQGDICSFPVIEDEYSHLIHAATDASAQLNETNPQLMFNTVVQGTQQALDFAIRNDIKRILFLSSGAIYGQQPWEMSHVSENWPGILDCTNPRNTYAEAKRAAEMLCAIYSKQFKLEIVTARIFALLGPYLPINSHFAAGNFIKNAIEKQPIIIHGNGLPCRSYLYTSDLIVWLLKMLVNAPPGRTYNVGSDQAVSIKELAQRIAELLSDGRYQVLGKVDQGWNPGRYVPNTNLIAQELGVSRSISLDDAILRTARWNGWKEKE